MELENQQQLDLIAQTIKMAQRRFYNDSPYYILWGSAVFVASIAQYVLLLSAPAYNAIPWAVCIPLALILQFAMIRRQKKSETIKTHIETLLNTMWMAFGITLFILLSFSAKLGSNTYPVVLCLYAITTFISGTVFKINAFLVGAIACWVFAILGFFVDFQYQLLLLAAGVLLAFIVPGIILRMREKSEIN